MFFGGDGSGGAKEHPAFASSDQLVAKDTLHQTKIPIENLEMVPPRTTSAFARHSGRTGGMSKSSVIDIFILSQIVCSININIARIANAVTITLYSKVTKNSTMSNIVKIVKNCQNCQKIVKIVKIVKKFKTVKKFKIVKKLSKLSKC